MNDRSTIRNDRTNGALARRTGPIRLRALLDRTPIPPGGEIALSPRLRTKLRASYACATLVLLLGLAAIFQTQTSESFGEWLSHWLLVLGNVLAFGLAVAVTTWIGRSFRENEKRRRDVEHYLRELEAHSGRLLEQDDALALQLERQTRLTARIERSKKALERSNMDLEQFAYVASHDLRAPLRGIANVSEWLEEDLGAAATPEVKKYLAILRGRVRRLEALIDGIAAYSRAGIDNEPPEIVDLGKLVDDVIELIAPPANVTVHIGRPLPTIETERTPIQQVLMNLLSNAIKHGAQDGGSVHVSSEDLGDSVRIVVRDDGPGIAEAYHSKVFTLFQTLSSRDKVEGSGIGLALVEKLVQRYGGHVTLESSEGKGAAFAFTWPKKATARALEAELTHE